MQLLTFYSQIMGKLETDFVAALQEVLKEDIISRFGMHDTQTMQVDFGP